MTKTVQEAREAMHKAFDRRDESQAQVNRLKADLLEAEVILRVDVEIADEAIKELNDAYDAINA